MDHDQETEFRFFFCPWRIGPTLTILRHLVVKEGPRRIAVQSAPYDLASEEFRRTRPVAYIDRLGWTWKWADPLFARNYHCPLGRL